MTFPRGNKPQDRSIDEGGHATIRYFDAIGREVGQSTTTAVAAAAPKRSSTPSPVRTLAPDSSDPSLMTIPAATTESTYIPPEIRELTLAYYLDESDFKNRKNLPKKPRDSDVSENKIHAFFTPGDYRYLLVTKLLKHVVRGEKDEVREMLSKDPSLVLCKGSVTDYSERTLEGTAWQMALGARGVNRAKLDEDNKPVLDANGKIQILHADEGMAEMIQSYFIKACGDNEKAANEEITRQLIEQFPGGYEAYENSKEVKERKSHDLEALLKVIEAIKLADVQFINGNYENSKGEVKVDAACEAALNEFREYLKPKDIINKGMHFNIELLVVALRSYDNEARFNAFGGRMDSPKNVLMLRQVIGHIQRYLTAFDAYAVCQGNVFCDGSNEKLRSSFRFQNGHDVFFPLDLNPSFRLGLHYAVLLGLQCGRRWFQSGTPYGETYAEQKRQSFRNLCSNFRAPESSIKEPACNPVAQRSNNS
jgi:hypothetical protein